MTKNKKRKQKRKYDSSKGHQQVSKMFRKLGYTVIDEFYIDNFPYDIYVKELNLIIEYYGDRWHYPKEIYPFDYWDKVKKQYAWQKWERDEYKVNYAKEKEFNIEIIWENQWKKITNKKRYIEKIINNLRK